MHIFINVIFQYVTTFYYIDRQSKYVQIFTTQMGILCTNFYLIDGQSMYKVLLHRWAIYVQIYRYATYNSTVHQYIVQIKYFDKISPLFMIRSHPLRGSKMHVTPSTFFIMVMNLLPLTSASTSFIHLQPGHLHHYRPWPYLGNPTAWLPPSMYYIPKYYSGLAKLSVCFF